MQPAIEGFFGGGIFFAAICALCGVAEPITFAIAMVAGVASALLNYRLS